MKLIEILEKRKEMLIADMDKGWVKNDCCERLRLEGQIRELNNLIYILSDFKG